MSKLKYKPNVIIEMLGCFYFLIVNLWVMLSVTLNAFGVGIKWYWTVLAIIINTIIFEPSDTLYFMSMEKVNEKENYL